MGALARGAAAGLAAALALSALARVVPGVWNKPPGAGEDPKGKLPADPFDPSQVRRWQEQSRSPAAFRAREGDERGGPPAPAGATPAGALTLPQGPGPEGLAEQFAFKVASGLFGHEISPILRPVGMATHLAYGSAWGAVYGLVQASSGLRPELLGPLFGLVVYGVGPAFLVPAMELMDPPQEEPPARASMLVLGHLVYGLALAKAFHALEGRRT